MSGTICTDSGGTTLKVTDCSDLGGTEAGDVYSAFCKVTSGPDAGKVVDKTGAVAVYDASTTAADINAGLLYFKNPNGGLRVGVAKLSEAEQITTTGSQGDNVSSFELCENGLDAFKTLITYTDGRVAAIDASKKTSKGQVAFVSPDGKSTRVVSGLSDAQIKLVTDMQGAEIGSCQSSKGLGSSYALLPTRTPSGSVVSWSKEDLAHLRSFLGGTSNRAFFCANANSAETGEAGTAAAQTTIAVNMSEGFQSIVRPLVASLADGTCGPIDDEKCGIAFEALREQFKSNFPFADPIKTTGEYVQEYGLYGVGVAVLGFLTGVGFALTGKWFGGGGGHGGGGGGSGVTTDDVARALTALAAAAAAAQKAGASNPPAPESHALGAEVPLAVAVVVAAEAAPGFWAGVGSTLWNGAVTVGEGAAYVGEGLLSAGARIFLPVVVVPEETGPQMFRPTSGSYANEQLGI